MADVTSSTGEKFLSNTTEAGSSVVGSEPVAVAMNDPNSSAFIASPVVNPAPVVSAISTSSVGDSSIVPEFDIASVFITNGSVLPSSSESWAMILKLMGSGYKN